MKVEMLPGLDNVVRFPIERRVTPSMEVMFPSPILPIFGRLNPPTACAVCASVLLPASP